MILKVHLFLNNKEFSPEEVLAKFEANEIKLIPPQIYEFKRMLKFKQFTKLAQYSQQRQLNGLTQWLPKFNKEFTFGVLPGYLFLKKKLFKIIRTNY